MPAPRAGRLLRATAVAVAASAPAYAATVFLPFLFDFGGQSYLRHPYVIVLHWVMAVVLIGLAVQLPVAWSDRRLPRWAVGVTAMGIAFLGAVPLMRATETLSFAWELPADHPALQGLSIWFNSAAFPRMALLGVGATALAIVGKRRGAIGWAGTILLLLTALVSLAIPPFPPAVLLVGLTFAIIGARPGAATTPTGDRDAVMANTR